VTCSPEFLLISPLRALIAQAGKPPQRAMWMEI
jgi:hypothetical protein